MTLACDTRRVGRWLAVWALTLALLAGLQGSSWGNALRSAQEDYSAQGGDSHILDIYNLLGDAALKIKYAPERWNDFGNAPHQQHPCFGVPVSS